ncbi:MAG: RNA polymerase sigma factor SigJ [Acidimicrobiales bacterium]
MTDLGALRRRAFDAGYRMLGSRADADDIAQETLLRVREPIERGQVRSPEAFTTTVATRLSIDHLRSARVRRESYRGPWLPEPIIERGADPVELAESLSYGLLVVLETLGPVERAAFLLHDVFAFGYDEVAATLDRSEAACRQLVARARRRVADGRPRARVDPAQHRALLERFLAASSTGDVAGLRSLLAEEVVLVSDGGARVKAARHPIRGRERVSRFVLHLIPRFTRHGGLSIVTINGEPGFVVDYEGHTHLAGTIDAADGTVTAIRWVVNPDKLR